MRPIDADALITLYKNWIGQLILPEDEGDERGITSCIEVMEDAPTLDVVEVVRCRNCKYCDVWGGIEPWFSCSRWTTELNVETELDAFCSFGEKK